MHICSNMFNFITQMQAMMIDGLFVCLGHYELKFQHDLTIRSTIGITIHINDIRSLQVISSRLCLIQPILQLTLPCNIIFLSFVHYNVLCFHMHIN